MFFINKFDQNFVMLPLGTHSLSKIKLHNILHSIMWYNFYSIHVGPMDDVTHTEIEIMLTISVNVTRKNNVLTVLFI